MQKPTLVIMAAGMGSRFGEGIKQLTPIGPGGEIIMDYTIHDAIEAGFNKVIFVIRKQIEADYREMIGDRIEKVCRELFHMAQFLLRIYINTVQSLPLFFPQNPDLFPLGIDIN